MSSWRQLEGYQHLCDRERERASMSLNAISGEFSGKRPMKMTSAKSEDFGRDARDAKAARLLCASLRDTSTCCQIDYVPPLLKISSSGHTDLDFGRDTRDGKASSLLCANFSDTSTCSYGNFWRVFGQKAHVFDFEQSHTSGETRAMGRRTGCCAPA